MSFIPPVQTRNVVVSNVMMSSAPKMTCPRDPHTHRFRVFMPGGTQHVCEKTISIVDIDEVRKTHIQ